MNALKTCQFLQILSSFAVFQCFWIKINANKDVMQTPWNDVEEYDVVHPVRLDMDGRFMTHDLKYIRPYSDSKKVSRRRRDANPEHRIRHDVSRLLFNVPCGDHVMTLNLTANDKLIPDSFVIERIRTLNSASEALASSINPGTSWHCHFQGHVEGQPNSRVALSTCHGLTGLLLTDDGDYFIEPLMDSSHGDTGNSQPHKIYRRDLSSSIDRAEPMLHFEKQDKLIGSSHDNHESAEKRIVEDLPDSVEPAFDEAHRKFCGVLDTRRVYRRIVRKREQWEAMRSESSEHHGDESNPKSRRRSKRSVSVERRIEMLVVVDRKMVEYYEKNDNGGVEKYVLTIMNMVSGLFTDASIGNSLHVSLVRLILLEDEKKGPKITTHAENTLDRFCKWAKKINPKSDSHPNHHDVAVLLTREEICSKSNKSCETLGLAHVAGMCQSHRSCNVNQDTGLSLAYTVAHELGHNFAMHHDGQLNDCKASPKYNHVMASHLTSSSLPMRWSSCSRKYITRFLDRNWGFCLNDEPADHPEFVTPTVLPGNIYDANHQCRLMFDEKSRYCYGIDDLCHRLWCYVDGTCRSRLHAAAPGTKCGKGKWCMGGKCVTNGKRPKPVDGSWSDWSSWSTCSRTCGIGVSSARRHCDNPTPMHGGKYCIGERKRYKTCNKWRCRSSDAAITFREQQCAAFNNVKYKNYTFIWKPVDSALYPCELHCYTKHKGIPFADRLRDKVIDGTKCFPGSDDICVDGICRRVGCDKNIGSRASEDRCGVCHGNGSTCYDVKKLYDRRKGEEYTPIGVIPFGSRNIEISEVSSASNFLALRHATNETHYYLNGNYMIQWDTKFQLAGTQFTYRRENETRDIISAPGPLDMDIMIVVLYVEENPGISMEYSVPYHTNVNKTVEDYPEFGWKVIDWTECPTECGKGIQILNVVCVEKTAGIVDDFFCDVTVKPLERKRSCNENPCSARWWSGPWDSCSVTCGSGTGVQRRLVMCVRSVGDGGQITLNHTECSDIVRPTNKQRCRLESEIPCPVWRESQWEQCSQTCGDGVTNRIVECVTYVMNDVIDLGEILDDDSVDIEEIDAFDMPHKVRKKSKRQKSKNKNLSRAKGLLMSIEIDPIHHDFDEDLDGYDVEEDSKCDSSQKPATQKSCNVKECPTTRPHIETTVAIAEHPTTDYVETTMDETNIQTTGSDVWNFDDGISDFQATSSTISISENATTANIQVPAGMLNGPKKTTKLPKITQIPKQTKNRNEIVKKPAKNNDTSGKVKQPHKSTRIMNGKHTSGENEIFRKNSVSTTEVEPFFEEIEIEVEDIENEHITTTSKQSTTTKTKETTTVTNTLATRKSHFDTDAMTEPTTLSTTTAKSSVDENESALKNNGYNRIEVRVENNDANKNDKTKLDPVFDVGAENQGPKQENPLRKSNVTKYGKDREYDKEDKTVAVPDVRRVEMDFDIEIGPPRKKHHSRTIPQRSTSPQSVPSTAPSATSPSDTEEPKITTKEVEPIKPTAFPGKWITGEWSECSTTCGIGGKFRTVQCSLSDEKFCNQTERPPPAIICNLRPCAKRVYGQWTECSTLCGAGTRTKQVECVGLFTGKPLRPHHCKELPPLTTVKISCLQSKCMPWKTSRWTSCRKQCGPGIQERRVACSWYKQCDPASKPAREKPCFLKKCVEWRPLEWDKCSVHCGGGIQNRKIVCIEQSNGLRTNDSDCIPGLKPEPVRKCNQGQCPVTDYDFSSCHSDRLSKSFCDILKNLGRCVQPSLAIQCCVTCQTYLSVRHEDKIS